MSSSQIPSVFRNPNETTNKFNLNFPCAMSESMFFRTTFIVFIVLISVSVSARELPASQNAAAAAAAASLSFPLTLSRQNLSRLHQYQASLLADGSTVKPYSYKSSFKYTMALVLSLPVGTPPQTQEMVLDTGSQLPWIQCHRKPVKKPPPSSVFDPALSSSFSALSCKHPVCKPRVPDFTLPTACDQSGFCHYSYFYADGTLAEGNLVWDKFAFSNSAVVLGCAAASSGDDKGMLGMNLGRLSFPTQAKVSKFSYCVPARVGAGNNPTPTGSFYLGENPAAATFQYVGFMTFPQSQRMPNLDAQAYTVPMQGIKIGGRMLDIPAAAFLPDAGGSGQTMIDSGSEFTFLVDEAYSKVKAEVLRLAGAGKLKKGYTFGQGELDMCFDAGVAPEVGRLVGSMAFVFGKGVEIAVVGEKMLADVGGGVHCVAVGMSSMLGAASNIIGNFHQQNMWVEFDLANRRVGFGRADCSRSLT